jgi:acyl-CoA dehydrogenase
MPCTPVREMDEVVNDPHMHGRGALRRVTHPELGGVVLTAAPLRYGDAPARDLRPSRPVGADTDAVLRDRLGLGDAEMAAPRVPSGRRARRRGFPFPVRTRDQMDFDDTDEQKAIREGVRAAVERFDDRYWLERDDDGRFPFEFHRAMAEGGWLGITMPTEYGGSGLGVTEAVIMMNEVSRHGGAMAAVSTVHINLFGPHPIVVYGTPEQKRRWIPRLVSGEDQCCFGVTEPDAGLDTTRIRTFARKVPGGYVVRGQKIWTSTAQVASKILLLTRTTPLEECRKPTDGITVFYTDLDRSKITVTRIPKMGRKAVDSNSTFIDDLFIPDEDRIGDEGGGFACLLHSLNPERILVGAEAIGIGQDALSRAARYARERVVFGRPIGQNQAIQHPLATNWVELEAAWTMVRKAAWLYDNGRACGPEANAAKLLGSRAAHAACENAVFTHGGLGYAKEYHVERLFREVMLTRIAPVTEHMILSFIGEKVLGLAKSY